MLLILIAYLLEEFMQLKYWAAVCSAVGADGVVGWWESAKKENWGELENKEKNSEKKKEK